MGLRWRSPGGLECSHISDRRADPFPSLLGKVARSAGWGDSWRGRSGRRRESAPPSPIGRRAGDEGTGPSSLYHPARPASGPLLRRSAPPSPEGRRGPAPWAYWLMPNPRPSDPRARRRRWARAGALPGAPALCRLRQRADRPSVSGAVRFGGNGRGPPDGGGGRRRAEPGARAAGRARGRLAPFER